MSPLWYWRYIPCFGIELDFEDFNVYEFNGRPVLYIKRNDNARKRSLLQKHIQHDPLGSFKKIDQIDFEIGLSSIEGDGNFNLDYVHFFYFLILIKTEGWISAPAILTHSTLEDPEIEGRHVYCSSFIEAAPVFHERILLTLDDVKWIKSHMDTATKFVRDSRFQNAMQALTSFHCIPYASTSLVVAWSGLEALFGAQHEISFRLSLYITNFIKSGNDRQPEFEKLRKSYDSRSRVAHGAATKAKRLREQATYTRNILRECLKKMHRNKFIPRSKETYISIRQ